MKTLETFIKQNKPKRRISKLKKFEVEIEKLYQDGFQIEQIKKFLSENKVEVSERTISRFITSIKKSEQIRKEPSNTKNDETESNPFLEKIQKIAEE